MNAMQSRFPFLMTLMILAGLLAACQPARRDPVRISEQDAGKRIDLSIGDTLIVALDGNITTGYNWISAPQNPELLKQVGETGVTPESDRIGAPGRITLRFSAAAKGETRLHLDYKRPWETDAKPERTFEVTVVVK